MTTQLTDEQATPRPLNKSNAERKAAKLRKQIRRKHDWRVQVWAESEQNIAKLQHELEALGEPREQLFKPDFSDPALLAQYANGDHASKE